MALEDGMAGFRLLGCAQSYQPNDAGVRLLVHYREFAEVLVERNQDSPFGIGREKDRRVARVFGPSPDPDYVVTISCKHLGSATPHAGIEQKPHDACRTIASSTRSRATRRSA